jgi:transposase InsO family protein
MIKEMRPRYSVPALCRFLTVSSSGYYAWIERPQSKRSQEEARIEVEIKSAHRRTRETFGAERLQKEMAGNGVKIGVCRIKRIRKKLGIKCKQKKKFKVTTDSNHNLPVADNILNQKFETSKPNTVWVSDITYIPTEEGWLYLAGHKDLFTGELVGYAMGSRMTKNLVSQSLYMAVTSKRPAKGLIHHSDRGSQYCAHQFRGLLEQLGMRVSMSRRGNCYDNAPMESLWGTIKSELVNHKHYRTREEAVRDIREYIEVFYNRQRTQKRLGYLSPVAYGKMFYEKRNVA